MSDELLDSNIIVKATSVLDEAKEHNGVVMLPEEPEKKDTLSPSKMKSLNDCEVKYYFRYVEGRKIPPTVALSFGSAYDDALTNNYIHKINNDNKDMPVTDVVDAFVTSFNSRKLETEFLSDENPDSIIDTGVGLVREYQEEIAPTISPIEVQKRYETTFPNVDWTLIGIIDLMNKDLSIEDNKTSKKSPSQKDGIYQLEHDHYFQLLNYSISAKMEMGMNAGRKLRIRYAVKTKSPKIITVEAPEPSIEDFRYFQNMTALTYQKMKAMENGTLRPTPKRNNMLCTKRFCGYWSLCEQRYGGRVKD